MGSRWGDWEVTNVIFLVQNRPRTSEGSSFSLSELETLEKEEQGRQREREYKKNLRWICNLIYESWKLFCVSFLELSSINLIYYGDDESESQTTKNLVALHTWALLSLSSAAA